MSIRCYEWLSQVYFGYEVVYADTQNIFSVKKEDAIVRGHDFRKTNSQYNEEVVRVVRDVLGEKFKNVYVTDHNL